MEITKEQAEEFFKLTPEKQEEHNENVYNFMILMGYEKPETDIYNFIDFICENDKFYLFYEKVMDVYYEDGLKNIKTIYEGMESFYMLNMFNNLDCIGRFLRLKTFFAEKHCEIIMLDHYEKKEPESKYEKRVIENFKSIFPNYKFINNQVNLQGIGIIDILAEDIKTKRNVIIELKIDSSNPKRQLLAYSTAFENPILVALTKKECNLKSKNKDIIYKVFK